MRFCITLGFLLFINGLVFSQKILHAYVFIGEECPICNYMGNPLKEIAKNFEDYVTFHAVFPLKNSNFKTAQLFKEQYGLSSFETLLDNRQELAMKFGASVTPEVVVTNDEGDILYKGRINSAYYAPGKMKHSSIKNDLNEALALLTSGKKVPRPWPSAIGCYITMNATK